MEHSYFKDRISAFHDNELKHEERQLIADHLEQCAECRRLLQELERFDAMVEKHSGLAGGEYWEESARKIEAAIGDEESTKVVRIDSSYRGLGWKLIGVAASIAIIAFIALYESDISDKVRRRGESAVSAPKPASEQPVDSLAGYVASEEIPPAAKGQLESNELKRGGAVDELAEPEEVETAEAKREGIPVLVPPVKLAEQDTLVSREKTKQAPRQVALDSPAKEIPRMSQVEVYQSVPPVMRDESARVEGEDIGDLEARPGAPSEVEPTLTLEQWRARRDSLEIVVTRSDQSEFDLAERASQFKAKKLDKQALTATVDSLSEKLEKEDPQLKLLEAYYQIGLLTDSAKERKAVGDRLRDYLEQDDSRYKLQAAWYLQQLEQQ